MPVRNPIKRVWNCLQFGFTLGWTAVLITVALTWQALGGSTDEVLRMAARLWAPGLTHGAGAKVEVQGMEAIDWARPYLIASNHQSVIDICVLFMATPVPLRFLLKSDMLRMPFVNWYAQRTGMLFIDRDNPRSAPQMLKHAAAMLGRGETLCVFPEGTRSRDGALAEFKAGPFEAASRSGVAVLPVALDGAGHVLPSDGFSVNPGVIRVRFGTPIPSRDAAGGKVDRNTLAAQAQAQVSQMLANGVRV